MNAQPLFTLARFFFPVWQQRIVWRKFARALKTREENGRWKERKEMWKKDAFRSVETKLPSHPNDHLQLMDDRKCNALETELSSNCSIRSYASSLTLKSVDSRMTVAPLGKAWSYSFKGLNWQNEISDHSNLLYWDNALSILYNPSSTGNNIFRKSSG